MRTHLTTKESPGGDAATVAPNAGTGRLPKRPLFANKPSRLQSWKSVLVQSLGRELNALHRQQQERAFMATSHGLNYCKAATQAGTLH